MTYYSYQEKNVTGRNVWFNFKELLKTAGWTVVSSSTGSVYNASGDSIASVTDINTSGWINLSHPSLDGYQRAVCIQWSSTSNYSLARIKIGWSGFSGGSPSATRVPTYSEERVLLGSGTDASPNYSSAFSSTSFINNFVCVVGDVTEKYSFSLVSYNIGTAGQLNSSGDINGLFMFQRLDNTSAFDIDPYVYIYSTTVSTAGEILPSNNMFTTAVFSGWYKKGYGDQAWVTYPIVSYANNPWIDDFGSNPYDNKLTILPIYFLRNNYQASTVGIKGTARSMFFCNTRRTSLTTLSKDSNDDLLFIGAFLCLKTNGTKFLK